jgi:hypothetical protein
MDVGNLVYAFFNNAGPGGVFAMIILGGACVFYVLITRWIIAGRQSKR